MGTTRLRIGTRLAMTGSLLGMFAGLAQATVGSAIPAWTGAKAAPVPLGLLTIVLSLIAAVSTTLAARVKTPGTRLLAMTAMVLPALICFTTVGRLWVPSGLLILGGAALIAHDPRAMLVTARLGWPRVLIGLLGGCEALLAAGSSPVLMVVGLVGAASLVTGAVIAPRRRRAALGLFAIGTVPFAVLAWTAFAPLLTVILVAAFARPAIRQAPSTLPA